MNNGPMLFLGLFASMAISWVTFVLGPQVQMGGMLPAQTVGGLAVSYPNNSPGLARQGAEVYRASGCAYCHTQQVRPTELGSDLAHGWGLRRSVGHDYIFDQPVMLGTQRLGPDLANAGKRMDDTAVLVRLWDPTIINHLDSAHSIMPAYKYFFEVRKIGRTPSLDALGVAAPAGYEIVPKPAARALAAYVANLRQEPYLFEAPPPAGAVSTNAPPAGTNAPAGGTNAPAAGTNAPAAGSGVPALPGGTNASNPQSAIRNPQSPASNPQTNK